MAEDSDNRLDFAQAMRDFKAMFPSLSPESIEAALRLNNGLVESTIDDLLLLSTPLARNEVSQPATKHARTTEPCTEDEVVAPPACMLPRKKRVYAAAMLKPLPRDFLRLSLTGDIAEAAASGTSKIARRQRAKTAQAKVLSARQLQKLMDDNFNRRTSTRDPQLRRCLEDESLAIMLQNEEFVRQLRSDADFVSALQKDNERGTKERKDRLSSRSVPPSSTTIDFGPDSPHSTGSYGDTPDEVGPFPYTKVINEDKSEVYFHEKLRHMGKASKQRFANLADKFLRKHKGAAGILGTSRTDCSRAQLLPDDGNDSADEESGQNAEGYNQTSDIDYNIGKQKDLKEGRLFGNFRSPRP
uniref:CUE domain-containing protein n=1 Tax=Trichuris muris TaxID=70415 RepID=A0A5S6QFM1_TRIMR